MREPLRLILERLATPIGELLVVCDAAGTLRAIDWSDFETRMRRLLRLHYGEDGCTLEAARKPSTATAALRAYMDGDIAAIAELPVETGGTSFQRAVWRALRDIPAGSTESYGGLARRLDRAAAVRAVGLANGANPIGIVVPCHRVIGADGSLTGYGGGLDRKRWLLRHEASHTGAALPLFADRDVRRRAS
jgi:methylated-DNA-[protein]-cysteine S-methyltransferase